jgi:hypothetical protein
VESDPVAFRIHHQGPESVRSYRVDFLDDGTAFSGDLAEGIANSTIDVEVRVRAKINRPGCAGFLVITKADFSEYSGLFELKSNTGDGRKNKQIGEVIFARALKQQSLVRGHLVRSNHQASAIPFAVFENAKGNIPELLPGN